VIVDDGNARTKQCTRVATSGVLTMENLSSRPGDCKRYATINTTKFLSRVIE
jgi:hypothetical protein